MWYFRDDRRSIKISVRSDALVVKIIIRLSNLRTTFFSVVAHKIKIIIMKFVSSSTASILVALVVSSIQPPSCNARSDPTFIDLLGDKLFPEGILELPDGRVMVGGFGDGSLQLVDPNNTSSSPSYFSAPGENGMVIAVGFAYDEELDNFWVANFNFDLGDGIPGSQLKVFSLNGSLKATVPSDFMPGVFFNEIALAKDGSVYVSDTFNPTIWKANPNNLTGVQEFATNKDLLSNAVGQPFGLNGLAITLDNNYLIASVMDRLDAGNGTILRISIANQNVTSVTLLDNDGGKAVAGFAGSDGMFFDPQDKQRLFMVNVFSSAGAIYTADFSNDYSIATLTIRDAFASAYNRPTASTMANGMLWTMNSQLDHIIDDENGALGTPPDLPFQMVGVPLAELFVSVDIPVPATPSPVPRYKKKQGKEGKGMSKSKLIKGGNGKSRRHLATTSIVDVESARSLRGVDWR
jgi:hypothetical protein